MLFKSLSLASLALLASAAPVPQNSAITGSGILLKNMGTLSTEYCFFNNIWNGDGTAGPNFDSPETCVTLAPKGGQQFVPLDSSFKGRVQRTKSQPATWVEFQLAASNDGVAHGDVSIEQGCDGPATIQSADGQGVVGGFTNEIVPLAPKEATTVRESDGQVVLQTTMGNWDVSATDPAAQAAAAFAQSIIDPALTYILGGTGVSDVASNTQAMIVSFY